MGREVVSLIWNGHNMKKLILSLVVLLGAAGAFAQSGNGVTVSTDPARAAAVERHAQELQARPAEKAVAPAKSGKARKHSPRRHHSKKH